MKKIVLTGATGNLGSRLREPLLGLADTLVSSDLPVNLASLYPRETYVQADLADFDAILALVAGADMVVHFGGLSDEAPFGDILGPNIIGSYNIWEAARRHGVRRVVYASSIHAVGMYPTNELIGIDAKHRPDSYYGLAKCFTEDLARLYWDKEQIEAVCLRILSCTDVKNTRALGSWLSYPDLTQLVTRAIDTPSTGFSVIYGVSNNDRATVDNTGAGFLGYRPEDNAEQFAQNLLATTPPTDLSDPGQNSQGGPFASIPLGASGVAAIKAMSVKTP